MKRRHRVVPFVLVAALLMVVGLGAYSGKDEELTQTEKWCRDDPEDVLDYCDCAAYEAEHFQDACQAGCFRNVCPELTECTGLDQMWCKPCDDMSGAAFWSAADDALSSCLTKFDMWARPIGGPPMPNPKYDEPFHECFVNHTLQLCPQLGPKWYARFEQERDNEGAHYGEFCSGNPPTCYHEETP